MDALNLRSTLMGLLLLIIRTGDSLIAYDCGAPSMNITTLSLLNIKECEIPIVKPITTVTKIQLLQAAEFSKVKVMQCKIELRRSVYFCGMHSHISAVSNGDIEYVDEISYEQCRYIHNTRSYQTYNSLFTTINLNGTTSRPLNLAGKVNNEGTCKGEHFSDHYGSWDDVIAFGQITFSIYDYPATVNLDKNEIILRSGVRCTYSKGFCMDIEGGNTFWELLPADQCRFNRFTVLYEGKADKIKDNTIHKYGEEIYSLTSDEITFALAVKGFLPLCGYKLIKTEHPRLFILDRDNGDFFTQKTGVIIANMDLFTYINTKFVYLERHLRNQIISLYNDVILQECQLENRVLHNSLALAPLAPADFAFHFMKEPGYIAHIAGEVVRIAKCVPVDVKSRRTEECFQELPISRGNESLFMLPRTHIITKTGNQIDCNSFLAPMYNINNAWYQALPQLATAVAPDEISSQTKKTWKYETPANLASGGIYSLEDLDKLRDNIMFPIEKPAVLHTIARGATGQNSINQGISVNSFIDENAIRKSIEEAWGKVYNFFNTVGTFSVTLLGAWVTLKGIKFIIDTLVHGYALHTIYGWSIWLIGAIWDSVTNLLLHLSTQPSQEQAKNQTFNVENQEQTNADNNEYSPTNQTTIELTPQNPQTSQQTTINPNPNKLASTNSTLPHQQRQFL